MADFDGRNQKSLTSVCLRVLLDDFLLRQYIANDSQIMQVICKNRVGVKLMKRSLVRLLSLIGVIALVIACSRTGVEHQSVSSSAALGTKSAGSKKPIILVSIAPQKYFVEQVAGKDTFEIVIIVPEGQSPHSYEPTPSQLLQMSKAVVWFTTGVEFEAVLIPKLKAIAPSLKCIDTTEGIQFRELEAHSDADHTEQTHSAEEQNELHDDHHDETGKDPHVWLGLSNAIVQSRIMSEALSQLMPEMQNYFSTNQAQFTNRIQELKGELYATAQAFPKKSIFVYHPAFGYLLDEIGFKQIPIEVDGKEPGTRELTAVINTMKQEDAQVIFVQKQFSSVAAKKIADAVGGQVVELDPLAYDWENNIRAIYSALTAALSRSGK